MEDEQMKKTTRGALALFALLVGALAYTAAAYACDGGHHGDHDGDHTANAAQFASFHEHGNVFKFTTTLTSPDTGCGDHVWANDTLKRTYIVKKNDDGSYRLTAFDRGTFVTVAGTSP